jgi:diaminopimelate epimerase
VELHFVKMHGLGNDFIVFDDTAEELEFDPKAIEWFCDRHFGIGADGIILVRPATTPSADFYMAYYNSDGSVAEMCGNGIRCFAKYVTDHGLIPEDKNEIVVETLGGLKPIKLTRAYDTTMWMATVDMGEPILAPEEIPSTMRCPSSDHMVVDRPLETPLGTFNVTLVSMGNPHCVLWVEDVDAAPVEELGPIIENHDVFPAKTNVEFAQLAEDGRIRLRVWERGCAETLACGTGACAAVVAASLTCRTGREAVVELPGGELEIRWAEDNHVFMTGPAVEVFAGVMPIAEDDETE